MDLVFIGEVEWVFGSVFVLSREGRKIEIGIDMVIELFLRDFRLLGRWFIVVGVFWRFGFFFKVREVGNEVERRFGRVGSRVEIS